MAIGDTLLQGPLNAKAGIRALSALQIQRNHTTKLDETEELNRVELSQQENGQPISSLILQECPNEWLMKKKLRLFIRKHKTFDIQEAIKCKEHV